MERICLICNPTAKSGEASLVKQAAAALLQHAGIAVTVYTTEHPGHATELAKKAVSEGFDTVVSVGGDGTLRETAQALTHTDVTLGLIPCGTGNDFAKTLHIPTDPKAAVDALLHGEDRWIDVGMANDQMFFNVAGIGFDVDVLDYAEAYKPKYKNGSTAYLRALLKALFGMKLRRAKITFEDGTMEKNVLLIAAGNGRFFGGGMEVTPNADPSDGLLDICIVHDVDLYGILTVLPKFLKGKHLGQKRYVTYRKEKSCVFECEPVSRMEVDGERMYGTPVTFRIMEHALKVRVPRVG